MATLAETTNTITTDFEEELLFIAADGKPVSRAVANKISDFLWASIEEAFEYSNAHKDTISPDKSLLDFFRERVDGTDFTPEEKELFIETSKMWGVYVGDGVDRQSLKFFFLEECIDGSMYKPASPPFLYTHTDTPRQFVRGIHLQSDPGARIQGRCPAGGSPS